MYAATYTRLTVRHVYSDRTRGELQVAIYSVFCSGSSAANGRHGGGSAGVPTPGYNTF
jgi:hypothetical protein